MTDWDELVWPAILLALVAAVFNYSDGWGLVAFAVWAMGMRTHIDEGGAE